MDDYRQYFPKIYTQIDLRAKPIIIYKYKVK